MYQPSWIYVVFTAIGGHLPTAPAMMGNAVVWKPSDTALLSNYVIYKILEEAGLPPGIIQFVPAQGEEFGRTITKSPDLAAITFTGSTKTFKVNQVIYLFSSKKKINNIDSSIIVFKSID